MQGIEIRRVSPTDAKAIGQLMRDNEAHWNAQYPRAPKRVYYMKKFAPEVEDAISKGEWDGHVAVVNNKIIGFVGFSRWTGFKGNSRFKPFVLYPDQERIHEEWLAVDQHFEKHGIASVLREKNVELVRRPDRPIEIFSSARADNKARLALDKRSGFELVGVLPSGRGAPTLIARFLGSTTSKMWRRGWKRPIRLLQENVARAPYFRHIHRISFLGRREVPPWGSESVSLPASRKPVLRRRR